VNERKYREKIFPAFYDGTLNMLLIDKMMRDGSYDFYPGGRDADKNGPFEADRKKADCFQKETMRVFTDYITVDKKLFLLVKTWQQVTFQTEDQRFITGRVLENAKRREEIAAQ
jgi:hypothetical protein